MLEEPSKVSPCKTGLSMTRFKCLVGVATWSAYYRIIAQAGQHRKSTGAEAYSNAKSTDPAEERQGHASSSSLSSSHRETAVLRNYALRMMAFVFGSITTTSRAMQLP